MLPRTVAAASREPVGRGPAVVWAWTLLHGLQTSRVGGFQKAAWGRAASPPGCSTGVVFLTKPRLLDSGQEGSFQALDVAGQGSWVGHLVQRPRMQAPRVQLVGLQEMTV